MIKTARQLKDLIRNLSREKSADAQILMRNYMMERFLERISLSEYRDKFILKGGMLVAAMVGLDARSTMDLDATIKGASQAHGWLLSVNWSGHRAQAAFLFSPYIQLSERLPPNSFV